MSQLEFVIQVAELLDKNINNSTSEWVFDY